MRGLMLASVAGRFHMFDERFRLLLHPRSVRLTRALRYEDCTAADVNESQHEILSQASWRPDPLREEVALIQRFGVQLQKLGPASLASVRAWVMPRLFHDLLYGVP